MASTTTRSLRENLRATINRAAHGEEVLVTKHGRPYVRLLPATGTAPTGRYPLRGSVRRMARDFDAPLAQRWKALRS